MPNSPNDYKFALNIKQDSVITHSQSVSVVILGEPLNVAVQTVVKPLDLPE